MGSRDSRIYASDAKPQVTRMFSPNVSPKLFYPNLSNCSNPLRFLCFQLNALSSLSTNVIAPAVRMGWWVFPMADVALPSHHEDAFRSTAKVPDPVRSDPI